MAGSFLRQPGVGADAGLLVNARLSVRGWNLVEIWPTRLGIKPLAARSGGFASAERT